MNRSIKLLLIAGVLMSVGALLCYAVTTRSYVASATIHVWKLSNADAVSALKEDSHFKGVKVKTEELSYEIEIAFKDPNRDDAIHRLDEAIRFLKEWGAREENRILRHYDDPEAPGRYIATYENPIGESSPQEIKRSW